jgi:protein involved in polysaccharide export with SLBB domain
MKLNCFRSFIGTAASFALLTMLSSGCYSTSGDLALNDNPTAPAIAGSVPAAPTADDFARFHIGDTVTVTLSGIPDEPTPHQEPIKEDGTITLPEIGKIVAVGKTAGELQNAIHDAYVPQYYTHLTVAVTIGDRVYYVRGEVKTPDRLVYVGEVTVTKAIASAGDFTDFADRRHVVLIRSNGQHIKLNCKKILKGDEPDPPVYPGDQIYVPRSIW